MMKTPTLSPELEAAKLWRDVIRRRNNLATAGPDDVAAATTAYAETLAAYNAVKAATV